MPPCAFTTYIIGIKVMFGFLKLLMVLVTFGGCLWTTVFLSSMTSLYEPKFKFNRLVQDQPPDRRKNNSRAF